MARTDKYVIVFVAGVIALVIVALVFAGMQPEKTYLDGDGPEAVAHNYLLALEQGDYDRAYAHLSPALEGYPQSAVEFARQVRREPWAFPTEENSSALALLAIEERGAWADAEVRMTSNYGNGLLGFNRRTDEFDLQLEQTDVGWKIAGGDRLFAYCWSTGDCR
jgi:hypothetical protein